MVTNLLKVNLATVENVEAVINKIKAIYNIEADLIKYVLEADGIKIQLLGRQISIPYYKKLLGKRIEMRNSTMFDDPVYDRVDYVSVSTEEIEEKINHTFSVNDRVYDEVAAAW